MRTKLPFINGSGYFNSGQAFGKTSNDNVSVENIPMEKRDVVNKCGICFSVLILCAIIGYSMVGNLKTGSTGAMGIMGGSSAIALLGISVIATIILGIVNAFSKLPKPGVIVAFAAFEGILVGAISSIYSAMYDGAVPTAVFATISVAIASYIAYTSGLIRPNRKFFVFLAVAAIGYVIFSLVNFILVMFGAMQGFGLYSTAFGPVISLFAIGLGALMLIADFSIVDQNAGRAPQIYAWRSAYGIMLDIVWIYLEILRLVAILNDRK
jgi:uncharacterized YccA/Bax inhibitor family protein